MQAAFHLSTMRSKPMAKSAMGGLRRGLAGMARVASVRLRSKQMPGLNAAVGSMSGLSSDRCRMSRQLAYRLHRNFFASRGREFTLTEARRREVAFSQSWSCASCGCMLRPDFQIDHIVPVAMGGHNGAKSAGTVLGMSQAPNPA